MEFKLTKEQKRLKRDILKFAQKELADPTLADRESRHEFSRKLWDACGEQKIQGLHVPEAFGGKGYGAVELALALEAMGNGCDDAGLLVSLGAHMLSCTAPLIQFGSDAQKQAWLPGFADGSVVAASAITEAEAGSDFDNLQTTATLDDGKYVLRGSKAMVVNAGLANVVLVYAVTDAEKGFQGGVTCFIVKTDLPGVSRGEEAQMVGYKTASIGSIDLDGVTVSAEDVLGEVGKGAVVYSAGSTWERSLLSAMHVGRMDYLLENTIMHARTRKSQGQPIGKNQSVSHRITDMKMRLEVGRLLAYKAAWSLENGGDDELNASLSKLFVSESMVESTLDAGQIFGGSGFLASAQTGRSLQDAFGSTLYSGTTAMQRNTIAKAMGLK